MAAGDLVTKSVVLGPGESIVLPASATIKSITIDGDISVTSSCGDESLPEFTGYACWQFAWESDESGALQDAIFETLTVGDNIYTIPDDFNAYNNRLLPFPGPETPLRLQNWINSSSEVEGVVKDGCGALTGGGTYFLKIRIPEGLPAPELKVLNPDEDGTLILYMKAVADTDCDTC